jgi:hypothetical protein
VYNDHNYENKGKVSRKGGHVGDMVSRWGAGSVQIRKCAYMVHDDTNSYLISSLKPGLYPLNNSCISRRILSVSSAFSSSSSFDAWILVSWTSEAK